jgi:hypothetical protein
MKCALLYHAVGMFGIKGSQQRLVEVFASLANNNRRWSDSAIGETKLQRNIEILLWSAGPYGIANWGPRKNKIPKE